MSDDFNITCPCCATKLLLDRETGEILSEERPTRDHDKTFEDAMRDVKTGADRRAKAFSEAHKRTTNLESLLEKKFEEARKKAARDTTKPVNPLDLD